MSRACLVTYFGNSFSASKTVKRVLVRALCVWFIVFQTKTSKKKKKKKKKTPKNMKLGNNSNMFSRNCTNFSEKARGTT
jgi:hypothetical protein